MSEAKAYHAALLAGVEALLGGTVEGARGKDAIDRLRDLADGFAPHPGDDQTLAMLEARAPLNAQCGNCGFNFTRVMLPGDPKQVQGLAVRGAFCPRCHCTDMERIRVQWDHQENRPPVVMRGWLTGFELSQHDTSDHNGQPLQVTKIATLTITSQLSDDEIQLCDRTSQEGGSVVAVTFAGKAAMKDE